MKYCNRKRPLEGGLEAPPELLGELPFRLPRDAATNVALSPPPPVAEYHRGPDERLGRSIRAGAIFKPPDEFLKLKHIKNISGMREIIVLESVPLRQVRTPHNILGNSP